MELICRWFHVACSVGKQERTRGIVKRYRGMWTDCSIRLLSFFARVIELRHTLLWRRWCFFVLWETPQLLRHWDSYMIILSDLLIISLLIRLNICKYVFFLIISLLRLILFLQLPRILQLDSSKLWCPMRLWRTIAIKSGAISRWPYHSVRIVVQYQELVELTCFR